MAALLRPTMGMLVLAGGLLAVPGAAAAFPDPYCVRDYANGVEPITRVQIDGIDNVSSAATGGTADEDFTAIVGQLAPGGEYRIAVQGNTNGPYASAIAAYFDWNRNGAFDAGEGYFIGKLLGSTGGDGQSTSMVIAVPAGAALGPTRMRLTKQFTAAATPGITDAAACGSTGAGQAEDYTINLDPLAPVPPTLALAVTPAGAQAGAQAGLRMMLGNTSRGASGLTADFATTLPAGLSLSDATTTCDGSLVAADGTNALTLQDGGAIPPGGCSISARIAAAAGGVFDIATGPLATDQGDAPAAHVTFVATQGGPAVGYATGFEAPFAPGALNGQQGWSGRMFDVATILPANGALHARATSLAAPTSATQPLAYAPHFAKADTRYATISANLRISRAGDGASWRFDPQDPDASLVTTAVRFDRAASRDIQLIDYSTGTLVNTGAQWPMDTYFNFRIIVNRINGALKLCMDGNQIHSSPSGAGTASRDITSVAMSQATGPGQTGGNTFDVDDLLVEYTPYGGCDGVPASYEVTANVGTGMGSITPSGTQTLAEGATPAFTLAAAAGQQIAGVSGTCAGFLAGNLYTTYPLAGDCTVIANFIATDPVASIAPAALQLTADEGRLAYTPLTIANAGAGTLHWAITASTARGFDHLPSRSHDSQMACGNPGGAPWLTANPASGALVGGASDNVVVAADATHLLPGTHAANLCVTTDDPLQPLIPVPVTLTVNPSDGIFCDGFEDGGNGRCEAVPLVPDIVVSGPLNHPIADDLHGTSVDWISGDIQDGYVAGYPFNPYDNNSQLTFWWDTGAPDIAGASSSAATSDFLVLSTGAVVGPASAWSTASSPGPAAWAAGATGYLGFRFNCSSLPTAPASGICYGYAHLQTTGPTGFPATILDYAYDQAGNPITIP